MSQELNVGLRRPRRRGSPQADRVHAKTGGGAESREEDGLLEAERAIINIFVDAAQALGLPKSVGEIYGLLSCSQEPLAIDDIRAKLRISKGSTSQGLRFLRNIRAVKTLYVVGDRRDNFVAERSLRRLLAGFLRERVVPPLENGEERLKSIEALLAENSGEKKSILDEEVHRLRTWNRKSKQLLPVLLKFIDI